MGGGVIESAEYAYSWTTTAAAASIKWQQSMAMCAAQEHCNSCPVSAFQL